MKKKKINHLLEAVVGLFSALPRGKVLDLGCGFGDYSKRLKDLGFDVIAADIQGGGFRYKDEIEFKRCDITKAVPFADDSFDYVLFLEVVEHLKNPYEVIPEISRIIKKDGSLIISTPNILGLKSRFRFLFEGAYEYFREPPLDQGKDPNIHLVPYRYQELEYLLSESGFRVANNLTSVYEGYGYGFLLPLIKWQCGQKEKRSLKKGGLDYSRINKILLSKELLFGRHLILQARKKGAAV
jgi:SAM-dependent methyltransferase